MAEMQIFRNPKQSILFILLTACLFAGAQQSVLTQHNNNNRTGWYDNESQLNKNNVRSGSFGKLFARQVDDEIYAQPLIKLNLNIPGKGIKNVVFVATVNNTVYAFDADSVNVSNPYWKKSLTPAHSRVVSRLDEVGACGGNYKDFSGNMGIVGTPVIDSTTNIIYLVSRSVDTAGGAKNYYQYLHAMDITTGQEMLGGPVAINALVDGTGDGTSGGKIAFNALHQNQRSGLLLANGVLYIAWSSHCDWGPYHGWLMGYDKTNLQQKYVYNTTPDGYNGGIWMSGGGPACDADGNIYLAVGNGTVGKNGDASDPRNRSETALKLKPSGTGFSIQSYFTPKNYETLEGADLDFGVTQVMLIPNTNRAVVGVKDGHIYLLDKDNMGSFNAATNNVLQTIDLGSNASLHASMSYFKGSQEFAYSWSENSLLRAYPYNTATGTFDLTNTIASGLQGPTGNSGAVLSVSSYGSVDSTGILWASYASNGDANQSVRPGILRAIDATDVTKELWNSSNDPNDNLGNYAKFNCPTVANGKVYVANFSHQLIVYGLTGNSTNSCSPTNIALNKPAVASSLENSTFPASYATDGNMSTRWSSQFSDPQYIYVDLGQQYSICRVVLHWETATAKNYKIQVSDDSLTWNDAAVVSNNVSLDNYVPVQVTGRYVRMFGIKRATFAGYSLYEFEVNGTPAASSCTVPTSLSATGVSETDATLHWSDVGVPGYAVQYKTVTAVNWSQSFVNTNTLVMSGLSCNTPYQYRIRAICSDNDTSDYSASGGFTTIDCNLDCDPLPTRWSTQDIGDVGITGSACYQNTNGIYEMIGSGADINGTSDQFRFAYKTITSSGEMIARVLDQDNTDPSNKVGVMVRESLAEGARYAFMSITSSNGVVFQYRSTTDGTTTAISGGAGIKAPYWLKLAMTGTTYTGYISVDGLVWTKIGNSVDIGFGGSNPVYGGLAITSHNNSSRSTAHLDNFSLGFVLPLNLISFTGRLTLNHTVALDWITTRETRTNYFVVERTTDNWNYTAIDTVYAENNGEFTQDYDALDEHPLQGTNYYRLRIVDMDGYISYSPIVAVKVSTMKSPKLYPNPSNTMFNIAPGTDMIKVVNVYNILGRTILRVPNASTLPSISIPTSQLSNGMYFVEIRTSTVVYIEKLLVHH